MSVAPNLAGVPVVVTGASGFLGRPLCRRLLDAGAVVHGLTRKDRLNEAGEIRWWKADLRRFDEVRQLWERIQPATVFHLAGEVNGAPRPDLLLPTFYSMVASSVNLLAASLEVPTRLILIGSLEEQCPDEGKLAAASPYAAAKTAEALYAETCHRLFGTAVVRLRTFMVYGPGQPSWKLIPTTIGALFAGTQPKLSSGDRELDWIFVDDVIDAFMAAATTAGLSGLTIDVGSGRLTSIRRVVEILQALIDPGAVPLFGAWPDRPLRQPRVADVEGACRHLGWRAAIPLEQGLRRTVDWHRGSLT